MKKISLLLPFILLFTIVSPNENRVVYAQQSVNLTLDDIFLEPVIPGVRPSFQSFSGDMKTISISWNDSAYFDTGVYTISLDDLTVEKAESRTPRVLHSPNNRLLAFTRNGDLYISNRDGSSERRLFSSDDPAYNINWAPNSRSIAFVKGGDVWVTNITRADLKQVTRRQDGEPSFSIDGWAGSSALILRQTDYSDSRTIYFPRYVGEFVSPGGSTRGIPKVTYFYADLNSSEIDTLSSDVQRSSTAASFTGRFIALDYSDAALKERKIIIRNTVEKSESILFEDSTDGWLSGRSLNFAPRSEKLFFLSEQTGWNHLYIGDPQTGSVEQITSGDFEIEWAQWLDDQTIIYANNEADYGERHLFIHDLESGSARQITSEEAYRYQFVLSPDKKTVIYAKTYFNEPYDLYMMDLENPGEEVRLTHSVPDSFYDIPWQKEEYVRFEGRDGETDLSMSVLYPAGYDSEQTYPVVVFAHGAGSLQNVYKGWSNNYWREYMFHQYLADKGYIVVEVDFRHSTGYGRKFREDVTNWMGKYETIDIVDGLDWLQEETGGALDLDNVGIYGGSYGGFMALYALTDKPERFHAGAALRKVSNWRNYYYANPWYTLPRLGDPDEVPEHYDRSSPLTYASELQHPVILLHGLIDDNVGAQDAFQYAEELIQSGHKDFEMMIYPSERHGFTSPNSWLDEYRRIFEFFEKHLK